MLNPTKKILWHHPAFWILVAVVLIITPVAVFAQSSGNPEPLPNPLGTLVDPRILIGQIISVFLGLVGSVALAIFIWGGFLWMTSAGNAERVTKGRNAILWAALGLAVIFSSYIIVRNVLEVFPKPGQTGPNPGQTGPNPQ